MTAATRRAPVRPAAPDDGVPEPDLLARARGVAAVVRPRAQEIESLGTLPGDVVDRLREERLFAMAMPRELGGLQARFTTMVEVVAELASADASTGWTTLIGNTAAFLAWLDPAAARRAIGADGDLVLAGSMAPTGRAEPVDGGFRLTGRWPFASGCRHADWMMGGFLVMEGDHPRITPTGAPDMRVGFFPADGATIDPTWDVMGLRGTGSNDLTVSDLYVPAEYTAVPYADPPSVKAPLTGLTPYNVLMVLFAGVPLGVARRALDDLVAVAATKRSPGGQRTLLDDPAAAEFLIRAQPALGAARGLVLDTFARVEDRLAAGAELTPVERAEVAAASTHAMRVGRELTGAVLRLGGTSATAAGSSLQRCHRDLTAAGQHIAFGPDLQIRTARSLLGASPPPALFGV